MKCSKCSGQIEKIQRNGENVFWFCRPCKIPHDSGGNALFVGGSLDNSFNVLKSARKTSAAGTAGLAAVTKTAVEMSLIKSLQEAYFAGMRDGVLLAYSQDIEEGEPMMEKVGVSNEELKKELVDKYTQLKERAQADLSKEASEQVTSEMDAVKQKIDELNQTN